jgi:hypothetical protein
MGANIKMLENGVEEHTKEYEWKSASVTVAGSTATTDITGVVGFTTLFATVSRAHRITIETTATAYFRLNADTNDVITVTSTTPYSSDYCVVDKIFVSTGGAAVTVTVKLR